MDHESDSDDEIPQHDLYSHAATAHLDFQDHIAPLYLPPPKRITMDTTDHFKPNESFRERVHRVQSKFTAAQLLCLRMEFNAFDIDASNTIDRDELRAIVDSLGGHHIHDNELRSLMRVIDEDDSGEVDWLEYLDMMLALQNGTAELSVAEFLTRHPIVLLVHPEKQAADYIKRMLYDAAREANIDIHVVNAYTAQDGLKFMKELPPGRKVSMMLSAYEMYPHGKTFSCLNPSVLENSTHPIDADATLTFFYLFFFNLLNWESTTLLNQSTPRLNPIYPHQHHSTPHRKTADGCLDT